MDNAEPVDAQQFITPIEDEVELMDNQQNPMEQDDRQLLHQGKKTSRRTFCCSTYGILFAIVKLIAALCALAFLSLVAVSIGSTMGWFISARVNQPPSVGSRPWSMASEDEATSSSSTQYETVLENNKFRLQLVKSDDQIFPNGASPFDSQVASSTEGIRIITGFKYTVLDDAGDPLTSYEQRIVHGDDMLGGKILLPGGEVERDRIRYRVTDERKQESINIVPMAITLSSHPEKPSHSPILLETDDGRKTLFQMKKSDTGSVQLTEWLASSYIPISYDLLAKTSESISHATTHVEAKSIEGHNTAKRALNQNEQCWSECAQRDAARYAEYAVMPYYFVNGDLLQHCYTTCYQPVKYAAVPIQ